MMTALSLKSVVKLDTGATMPTLGFGVALSKDTVKAITAALEAGYRLIDSARHYHNEGQVAEAIKKFNIPREEIFFTTKVMSSEHGTAATARALEDSLKTAASAEYFDLVLLHDPNAGPEKRLEAYSALLKSKNDGTIKNVGVSNYGVKHLKEIADAGLPAPVVNQIELHPWCQQKEIVTYCNSNDIVVQAFCPLVRGDRMSDPTLMEISEAVQKTPAQVLLRWSLQRGFVPLPKSDTPSRIKSNAEIYDFELSKDQMAKLDALDKGKAGACSWNPVDAP